MKTAVAQADSRKKKAVTTIDTADYNRRMLALSNNDTRKMAGKTSYIATTAHYCHTIDYYLLLKFIFDKTNGLWRIPSSTNDRN
jgi:hypothetical protein